MKKTLEALLDARIARIVRDIKRISENEGGGKNKIKPTVFHMCYLPEKT